jgi:hypothetical protein
MRKNPASISSLTKRNRKESEGCLDGRRLATRILQCDIKNKLLNNDRRAVLLLTRTPGNPLATNLFRVVSFHDDSTNDVWRTRGRIL